MNNNNFSSEDKKYILDVVEDEYNLLHRRNNKISLLVVKRNVVFSKDAKEIDFLNDNSDIYEIIDRMLSPKYNNLEHNRYIDNYEIIELDCFIDLDKEKEKIKKEEEKLKRREKEANEEFINKYGNVSIFILLGAILISLGVIIMIINILRG